MTYKIKEKEQENKNLINNLNKINVENEKLNDIVENLRSEKMSLKNSLTSNVDVKREQSKHFHQNISSILTAVVKTKNKYQQELLKLKVEVEGLNLYFESKFKPYLGYA